MHPMLRKLFLMLGIVVVLACIMDNTWARSSRSGGSGGSGKHATGNYIVRSCKTAACFKKHPTGRYGFTPKPHKTKG